jgi:hypothetical protein
MPLYFCKVCNISTKILTHHKRHLKTKKHERNEQKTALMNTNEHKMNTNEHKMNTNEHKMNTNIKFNCEFCNKLFNTKPSQRRHELHYCKKNHHLKIENKQNKTIQKMIVKHNNEKTQLYNQIEKLIDKSGYNTLNIQNNNNTLNNVNIKLNSYGKEDLSHITDLFKTNLLKGPYGMIPKMIEAVHFNDNKPENKNIQFTNKRDNKIKIFSNDKWIHKNKEETINDLMDGKYFILDTHYSKLINNEDGTIDILNFYDKFRRLFDEREKNLIDEQKKECELILLNNR